MKSIFETFCHVLLPLKYFLSIICYLQLQYRGHTPPRAGGGAELALVDYHSNLS